MTLAAQHNVGHGDTPENQQHLPVAIVEDDEDDRALIRHEVLNFFGDMPLLIFKNGAELFDYLDITRENGAEFFSKNKPRLILLDIQMPGESGIDVLKRLRAHESYAGIPVMIVSGMLDEKKIAEAEKCGVTTFVSKPISMLDLMESLNREDGFYK